MADSDRGRPVRTWVRLDIETVAKLDRYCAARGVSRSRAMRETIQGWIDALPDEMQDVAKEERRYDRSIYMERKTEGQRAERIAQTVGQLLGQVRELADTATPEQIERIIARALLRDVNDAMTPAVLRALKDISQTPYAA